MNDPTKPEEWAAAVDAADFCLLIDSAQQYGLIEGGDNVNVDRCAELLNAGADRGVFPTPPDRRRAWIAHWLGRERAALGITQRLLGRCVGRSAPWISQVERGATSIDDAMVARLREAIGAIREEQRESQTPAPE